MQSIQCAKAFKDMRQIRSQMAGGVDTRMGFGALFGLFQMRCRVGPEEEPGMA